MPISDRSKLFKCALYDKRDKEEPVNEVEVVAMNKKEALSKLKNRFYPKATQVWEVEQLRVISRREEKSKMLGSLDESFTAISQKE